jgi:undecaprenyl diphosphate synthase
MIEEVSEKNIPKHIALIMDGNRTWAQEKNLPKLQGHKAGAEALKKVVERTKQLDIKYLTVYAFSTENWNRSQSEVDGLMNILKEYLNSEDIKKLKNENVKITFIGNKTNGKIPADILSKIYEIEKETENKTGFYFNIAFNYGGRDEIINAIKNIPSEKIATLTDEEFSSYLYTKDIPDPDLIIRTNNKFRISNFLLWQSAYSEYIFTDTLWPDFDEKELDKAINEYSKRVRTFGKRVEKND